jgi:hypothetical protein
MIGQCTNAGPKAPFWGLNLVHNNNNTPSKHNIASQLFVFIAVANMARFFHGTNCNIKNG